MDCFSFAPVSCPERLLASMDRRAFDRTHFTSQSELHGSAGRQSPQNTACLHKAGGIAPKTRWQQRRAPPPASMRRSSQRQRCERSHSSKRQGQQHDWEDAPRAERAPVIAHGASRRRGPTQSQLAREHALQLPLMLRWACAIPVFLRSGACQRL
jgi:hypothetical protein